MDNDLNGKVALITGSSRGIGAAIALRLASKGADIILHYVNSETEAYSLVDEIKAKGRKAWAIQADLGQKDGVSKLFSQLPVETLDIFVNNAAIAIYKSVEETTAEDFEQLTTLNNFSAFFALQEAIKRMNDGGRIINISSCVTRIYFPTVALYAATKGFIDTITLQLAPELAARNITVNAVAPGATDTKMSAWIHEPGGQETLDTFQALPGIGQPSYVAGVVAFLASPDGCWTTGQIIDVSGGLKL